MDYLKKMNDARNAEMGCLEAADAAADRGDAGAAETLRKEAQEHRFEADFYMDVVAEKGE